jgi:dTDP-4-dehydrorhamnose reductase
LRTIHKAAHERELLRVVADQQGAPTWSRDLAKMATHVIGYVENLAKECGQPLNEVMREVGGIYHAAGSGSATWFDFAEEIVMLTRRREPGARLARVEPISTAEFPTPARRPKNSKMDGTKLESKLGWKMMDWRESAVQVMDEL